MKDNITLIIASVLGPLISFFYGSLSITLIVLIALMGIDFLTGIMDGVYNNNLDSRYCYKGIFKKITILIMVAVSHLCDVALNITVCMNIVIIFYLTNEAISIIENSAKLGVPFPKKVLKILNQIKEENDIDEKKGEK